MVDILGRVPFIGEGLSAIGRTAASQSAVGQQLALEEQRRQEQLRREQLERSLGVPSGALDLPTLQKIAVDQFKQQQRQSDLNTILGGGAQQGVLPGDVLTPGTRPSTAGAQDSPALRAAVLGRPNISRVLGQQEADTRAEERTIRAEERTERRALAKEQRAFDRKLLEQAKKAQTPENAAKISLVSNGLSSLNKVDSLVFDKDGNLNDAVVAGAAFPLGTSGIGQKSRQLKSLMLNAINAQLRAESGAAVPEEEVQRATTRFLPTPFDSADTAKLKLDQLRELLRGTITLTSPEGMSGRLVAPKQRQSPLAGVELIVDGVVNRANPTIQNLFDAGFTEQEIIQRLEGQ